MLETISVPLCYTTIDSRVMRVGSVGITMYDAAVDEVALLASDSMGGPQVHIKLKSQGGIRQPGFTGCTFSTWRVNWLVCIPEEMYDVMQFLDDSMDYGTLPLPDNFGPGVTYRLRGGELLEDLLSAMPCTCP